MRSIPLFTLIFSASLMHSISGQEPDKLAEATHSVDAIVTTTLEIVSGEKGAERDWDLFRQLFLPEGRLAVLTHASETEKKVTVYTVEDFIKNTSSFYENNNFLEEEITKRVDEYNGIATVFQSFYLKTDQAEGQGINTYQLTYLDGRWWIYSLLWTNDWNGVDVPEKYLKP